MFLKEQEYRYEKFNFIPKLNIHHHCSFLSYERKLCCVDISGIIFIIIIIITVVYDTQASQIVVLFVIFYCIVIV